MADDASRPSLGQKIDLYRTAVSAITETERSYESAASEATAWADEVLVWQGKCAGDEVDIREHAQQGSILDSEATRLRDLIEETRKKLSDVEGELNELEDKMSTHQEHTTVLEASRDEHLGQLRQAQDKASQPQQLKDKLRGQYSARRQLFLEIQELEMSMQRGSPSVGPEPTPPRDFSASLHPATRSSTLTPLSAQSSPSPLKRQESLSQWVDDNLRPSCSEEAADESIRDSDYSDTEIEVNWTSSWQSNKRIPRIRGSNKQCVQCAKHERPCHPIASPPYGLRVSPCEACDREGRPCSLVYLAKSHSRQRTRPADNARLRDLHQREGFSFQQIHDMGVFGSIGVAALRRRYQKTAERAVIEGAAAIYGDDPDLSEMADMAREAAQQ